MALGLLHAFPASSLQSDSLSVNQVIRSSSWRWAVRLTEDFHDVIGVNSALGACAASGRWDGAVALLQAAVLGRLHPDAVSNTEVMRAVDLGCRGGMC